MTDRSQSSVQVNRCVRLQPSADGLLTLWIETPERKVNVFDADMIEALECAVDHIRANLDVYQAVVFRSKKECFFVGADVQAIAQLQSEEDASDAINRGQSLMAAIEALPLPTVAAIDGPCLGGGLELALACDFRLARSNSRTRIALPEIKLGLIPGWGGTQRLPQLIGLRKSLEMILKGKAHSAVDAQKISLVDFVFADDAWEESVTYFCKSLATDGELQAKPWRKERRQLTDWLLDSNPVGQFLVFRATYQTIAGQLAHYPALGKAVELVRQSIKTKGKAFELEKEAFVSLLFTDTARSLLSLFQHRDQARKATTWIETSEGKPIKRVAIIGAGAMGAGIGALAASKGYEVVFKEIHDGAAEAGRKRTYEILRDQADRGKLSLDDMQAALARMEFSSSWEDIAECDLAIEAVLEIEAVKKEVFQLLDRTLRPGAILATNTSSLSVTRMGAGLSKRNQVAGLHFFNPVQRMDLVEVVRTEATDSETMDRLVAFVNKLGKTPIVTSDKPGFLVNRVLFPYLGEAVRMVSEGYDVANLDRQMRQFGMPRGLCNYSIKLVSTSRCMWQSRSMRCYQKVITPPHSCAIWLSMVGWGERLSSVSTLTKVESRVKLTIKFRKMPSCQKWESISGEMA